MSSAEEQGISGISVDVDHNPYLAEGTGTVDAIVSIAAGHDVAATAAAPDRVEAIIIDCSTSMQSPFEKFDAAKRATAAAIDELVDGTYFTIVAGTEKATVRLPRRRMANAGERSDQGGGDARRRRPAAQRRDRDGHLARARPRNRHPTPGGAHPRDPAHRRQGRARNPRTTAATKSRSARANSPATAEEWEPTGRSTSCVRSRRHCWVPSTSSPIPRISQTISQR